MTTTKTATATVDPQPGPWLVDGRWRKCRECDGPTTITCGGPDGRTLISRCKNTACGGVRETEATERKENRTCTGCSFMRRVVVAYPYKAQPNVHHVPRWREQCEACELERSAANHLATGRAFLERAKKIRAAR